MLFCVERGELSAFEKFCRQNMTVTDDLRSWALAVNEEFRGTIGKDEDFEFKPDAYGFQPSCSGGETHPAFVFPLRKRYADEPFGTKHKAQVSVRKSNSVTYDDPTLL